MADLAEFVSAVQTVPYNEDSIYNMLSDLSNLEKIKDRIPQDKVKDFVFDQDTCSLEVPPAGKVTFQIVEREPHKLVKFATTNSPIPLYLWIQLKQVAEMDTKLKITLRAELNAFLKPMLTKPLQEAVDKLALLVAELPY